MKRLAAGLLGIARMAMELSWLYACCSLTLQLIGSQPYSSANACATFVAAWFCADLRGAARAPRAVIVLLQVGVLSLCMLRGAYAFSALGASFWRFGWLGDVLARAGSASAWFEQFAHAAWTLGFWLAGSAQRRRSTAYAAVCARFDRGLLALFAVLLMRLILRGQPGVVLLPETHAPSLLFFSAGLLAIAVARNSSHAERRFVAGQRGIGLLVSLGAGALGVVAGAALLLVPTLAALTERSAAPLQAAGAALSDLIAYAIFAVLLAYAWLWGGVNPNPPFTASLPIGAVYPTRDAAAVGGPLPAANPWPMIVLAVALTLALVGWWLWRLRSTQRADAESTLLAWCSELWAQLRRWLRTRFAPRRGQAALRAYLALQRWGRHSGLPRRPAETPFEYGRRLQLHASLPEIDSIVAAANLDLYAPVASTHAQERAVLCALRRLHSPRLWLLRLRLWITAER